MTLLAWKSAFTSKDFFLQPRFPPLCLPTGILKKIHHELLAIIFLQTINILSENYIDGKDGFEHPDSVDSV